MTGHLKLRDINFITNSCPNVISPCFTYIFDKSYKVPKASVYILLSYPDFFTRLKDYSTFFELQCEHFLMTYDSFLSECMVGTSIYTTDYGIKIRLCGISTRISYVCTLYINFIFNNQDESRYHLVYLQIEKKLISEKFAQSYKRLFRKLKSLYIPGYQMPEELLDGIKSQEILNVKQFNYKLYIIGNIEVNEGLKVEEALKRHRQQVNASEPQSNNKISKVVTVRTFDISNNACGIFYYLNKSCDLRMKAIGSFIVNSVEEMFFDQLRTKEEFGYVVSAGIYTIKDDDFLYFVVQSDRNVEEIKERILRFITFTKDYIKNMSEQEFLERQESLIDLFKEKRKNLYGYSFFLYSKYISGIDGLTFINDICNVIKKMELKDVLNCDIFSNEIIITTEK